MDLLDTTEGVDHVYDFREPHGVLFREHRKLTEAQSGEDKIKRLNRIQKIVEADPASIPTVMELMFKSQAQEGEREVVLQIREVLLDCLIHMIEWPSSMDPELCTRAMDFLIQTDFPNDRNFILKMDEILLEEFPYSYTVHRHIQERHSEAEGGAMKVLEETVVAAKTVKALKELEQRSGTKLLNGATIDVQACKDHTELPVELLQFAACQELNGNFLAALSIFKVMRPTMRSRPLFKEYAPFLVHLRKLLYRSLLAPQIITDDKQIGACKRAIIEVDEELSFITGGWNPAFPGTKRVEKMMEDSEETECAGAPLNGLKQVYELVVAFNHRFREGLPN